MPSLDRFSALSALGRRRFLAALVGTAAAVALPARAKEPIGIGLVGSELAPLLVGGATPGAFTGLAVDAVAILARHLGWRVGWQSAPWARAQHMVEAGEADAFCTMPSPERQAYAVFSRQPMFAIDDAVMHFRADNPRAPALRAARSLADLRSCSVVTTIGDNWPGPLFRDWPEVREVRDDALCISMVLGGRADFVLMASEFARVVFARMGVAPLEARKVDFIPGGRIDYHFGLRRTFPDVVRLVGLVDEAIGTNAAALRAAQAGYG